ncbi:hypothetical protein VSU19_19795 [Verrucomicrobiales bacterium BCK34]|nr:hypothetical protein [Verrucomicrobiales bacterium BCK34]
MNDSEHPPEGEFSQEPVSELPMFQHNGKLYIAEGAEVPTGICINCGRPSVQVARKSLRNPYNPSTWIGAKPRLQFGLCKQHKENSMIMRALAFSTLVVGLFIFAVGLVSFSIGSIVFGGVMIVLFGFFRSLKPIWSPNTKIEPIEICGTGKQFRSNYPEVTQG